MIQRILRLWQLSGTPQGPLESLAEPDPPPYTYPLVEDGVPSLEPDELFMVFDCPDCGQAVEVDERIEPGQIGLTKCSECGETWACKNPKIVILRANDPAAREVWPYASEQKED